MASWRDPTKRRKLFKPTKSKRKNSITCGMAARPVCRPRNYGHTKKYLGKKYK